MSKATHHVKRKLETTHVRLAKAAEVLGVEEDSLLIAAAERRIQLYWLLNAALNAEKGHYQIIGTREKGDEGLMWMTHESGVSHFLFVPLIYKDAANLLKDQRVKWWGRALSLKDTDGRFWALVNDEPCAKELGENWDSISRDTVFLISDDLEKLKSDPVTPAPGSIEAPIRLTQSGLREKSALSVIAGILAWMPRNKMPSVREIETAAYQMGCQVTDDTIRKALRTVAQMSSQLSDHINKITSNNP